MAGDALVRWARRNVRRLHVVATLVAGAAVIFGWLEFRLTGQSGAWVALPVAALPLCLALGVADLATRRRVRRGTRQRVLLLTGSTFVAVALVELFLRFGLERYAHYYEVTGLGSYTSAYRAQEPSWYHVRFPGDHELRTHEFTFAMHINRLGLRDEEFRIDKAPDELRILALGDSFTEGHGAAQDEAWPKVLERRMSAELDRPVTVMNAGIGGSDPVFEDRLLEDKLLRYAPDVVIVATNSGDVSDLIYRGGFDRFQADGTVRYAEGPGWEWAYAMSFLVRTIVHDVLGYDRQLLRPAERRRRAATATDDLVDCLGRIQRLGKQHGFATLVVFHPFADEMRQKAYWDCEPLYVRAHQELHVPVIDLGAFYLREGRMTDRTIDDYYWAVDTHHNARGYVLFARGVREGLRLLGY